MYSGRMWLPVNGKPCVIFAGSYLYKPSDAMGIRVAAEIDKPAEAVVPIRDMGVPGRDIYFELYGALLAALYALARGRKVYVGCMGGYGRTGLFLGLLVRCLGHRFPTGYVRYHYTPQAIETPEQEVFIREFDLSPLRLAIKAAVVRGGWVPQSQIHTSDLSGLDILSQ